ncbi:MAG: MoaD/ThiS family protein [Reichenbachiella sp.]
MKLSIISFGIVKDIIGQRALETEVEGNTVGATMAILRSRYPKLSELESLLVAVNEEYAEDSFVVKEGDEVVLIPPVSGG